MTNNKTPCTIYTRSEFMGNIVKYEGKLIEHGTTEYAQYKNAVFVKYVPKGKRKVRGFVQGYGPSLLILEGVGHPEPDNMYNKAKKSETTGMMVSSSRYSSHDERWQTDFNQMIESHIQKNAVNVMGDYRGAKTA